jgi:hypothetical protein
VLSHVALVPPRVPHLWTCLLAKEGSDAATCPAALDPRLPAEKGSGAATCPAAPDLPPCRGGLRCRHMFCSSKPHLSAKEGSGASMCPTTSDPASSLRRAPVPPRVSQL